MKILRIIYDWPKPWQGLAPHPYEVTVAQQKLGHEVTVFSAYWPKAGGIEKPNNLNVISVLREPFPGTVYFTSAIQIFFKYLFWRRKNKVDVIHSHGHFGIWIYWYRNLLQKFIPWSKELKTPLIVHFHNIPESRENSLKQKGVEVSAKTRNITTPWESRSAKYAIKTAAALIFVSEAGKNDAIKLYGADPRRCFVVETGVNPTLFCSVGSEEIEKSRKDLGLDPYDKVVLNHGVLSERKNIHLIVEAMKYLPENYKLLLVGNGEAGYIAELNDQIKMGKLDSRVIRVGYTPYPNVPIAYQVSNIFVLPSSYEGLPKAVMQGLSCGTPCLVSGFKLSEEIKGLFYLDDLEPKAIAARISEIVENPPIVDKSTIARIYSWEKRTLEIDKVYEFAKKNYLV